MDRWKTQITKQRLGMSINGTGGRHIDDKTKAGGVTYLGQVEDTDIKTKAGSVTYLGQVEHTQITKQRLGVSHTWDRWKTHR